MNVASPGFASSSGGYYSFSDNYSVSANVFNHGGFSGGGGPYGLSYGTRVLVQTAATVNEDTEKGGPASIFADSLQLVQHNGTFIASGDNASLLRLTDVSSEDLVPSPFGLVNQQELIYEFWLPGYTGDIRVEFNLLI